MSLGHERMKKFVGLYGADLVRALGGSGIYFPVALAQACQESEYGDHQSSKDNNNFFSVMKDGQKVYFATPYLNFMAYRTALLDNVKHKYIANGLLTATTPQQQLHAIAYGGYCSNPSPAGYIVSITEMMDKALFLYKTGKL